MNIKYKLEEVRSYIESWGYKLLSTEYVNNKEILKLKCPQNHLFNMSFHTFKSTGNRCAECAGLKKKTLDQVKEYVEIDGYKLLSTVYKNALSKLELQCPKGHIFKMKYNNFQRGQRCPECNGGIRLKYIYVKEYIESFGYKLLSTEYKNALTKLRILCLNGHIFEMSYGNFRFKKYGCPKCSYINKSSKPEKIIVEYVKTIYSGTILENDRTQVKNYWTGKNLELDIFLPDVRKAIEFNGEYWHSSDKAKWYDEMKKKQCIKKKIDLFIINERDWINNKENCLEEIKKFIC